MISVDEATARIVAAFAPLEAETVALADAAHRVLAEDAIARVSHPPAPVSAMDGYAVRAGDLGEIPKTLRVIGTAPAGHPFAGTLGGGEAVRIFTGGVVPQGADAIVIQENAKAEDGRVTVRVTAQPGRHIRAAGLDFRSGDVLAAKGKRLTARDLALLAGGDLAALRVVRKPRVAFAATGDELSRPGEAHKPGGIVASSGYGLAAMIGTWGGEPRDLGILPDDEKAIAGIADAAADADLIVTLGGASVGDHDLVQRALGPQGFALDFWKIAMRPGKPLIFGRLKQTPLIGLPGNPVSSFVGAVVFVRAAIAAMLGAAHDISPRSARLVHGLPANDSRQDYLRAKLSIRDGESWVDAFTVQDSAMMSALARADALILRRPHAPAVAEGERVAILPLDEL